MAKTKMGYVIALIMVLLVMTSFTLTSGNEVSAEEVIETAQTSTEQCVVTYKGDFGNDIIEYTIVIDQGDQIPFDQEPPKGNGEFIGWFTDSGEKFEKGSVVNDDITLTAIFITPEEI